MPLAGVGGQFFRAMAAGGWMKGLGRMGVPAKAAVSIGGGIGRGMGFFAGSSLARRGLYGGMAGGAYGMMSNDTSVLGGATMGTGIGLGAARYGGQFLSSNRALRGAVSSRMARYGLAGRATGSLVKLDANRGMNAFSGLAAKGLRATGLVPPVLM